ncbi:hypothetical protein PoB_002712200 [Plakobranchus ocellatus]|uniref:Fibronectin type-III domain-containing protein n=1 Tax=Plakobranchus ocellatus TaxID=259542 RepID=A0AAV4A153_9GAST|nr:hypothetical protein PoB_002712200 [Plakobranchus ocellatus]
MEVRNISGYIEYTLYPMEPQTKWRAPQHQRFEWESGREHEPLNHSGLVCPSLQVATIQSGGTLVSVLWVAPVGRGFDPSTHESYVELEDHTKSLRPDAGERNSTELFSGLQRNTHYYHYVCPISIWY